MHVQHTCSAWKNSPGAHEAKWITPCSDLSFMFSCNLEFRTRGRSLVCFRSEPKFTDPNLKEMAQLLICCPRKSPLGEEAKINSFIISMLSIWFIFFRLPLGLKINYKAAWILFKCYRIFKFSELLSRSNHGYTHCWLCNNWANTLSL